MKDLLPLVPTAIGVLIVAALAFYSIRREKKHPS